MITINMDRSLVEHDTWLLGIACLHALPPLSCVSWPIPAKTPLTIRFDLLREKDCSAGA